MIDIHCHILPNMDDGADSLQTALMMAAMAADDGVEAIIATPHMKWAHGRPQYDFSFVKQAVESFNDELNKSRIPIRCYAGAEVLCTGTPAPVERDLFPTLGNTAYALVEFYFNERAEYMDTYLRCLTEAGIRPIIAHPERYDAVRRNKKLSARWAELGYGLQINKGSPLGDFGFWVKRAADHLLKKQLVTYIATDAHNLAGRTTRMKHAKKELSDRYGSEYISCLMDSNPALLLEKELV